MIHSTCFTLCVCPSLSNVFYTSLCVLHRRMFLLHVSVLCFHILSSTSVCVMRCLHLFSSSLSSLSVAHSGFVKAPLSVGHHVSGYLVLCFCDTTVVCFHVCR